MFCNYYVYCNQCNENGYNGQQTCLFLNNPMTRLWVWSLLSFDQKAWFICHNLCLLETFIQFMTKVFLQPLWQFKQTKTVISIALIIANLMLLQFDAELPLSPVPNYWQTHSLPDIYQTLTTLILLSSPLPHLLSPASTLTNYLPWHDSLKP